MSRRRPALKEFTPSTLPGPRGYEDQAVVVKQNDGSNSVAVSDGLRWRYGVTHDPDTNKLYGASGQDISYLVSGAATSRLQFDLVTFGDSLGMNSVYSDGTSDTSPPRWFVDSALNNNWRAWGYPAWVGTLSMQQIQVLRNYAVQTNGLLTPGVTPAGFPLSRQIDAYLSDRAAGLNRPSAASLMVGTNDTAYSIAACEAELRRQVARLDVPVFLMTAPPRGGTVTSSVGDSMQLSYWLQQWRAVCRRVADSSGGRVQFVDTYRLVNSPTTVPDVIQAGYTYDNIHGNNAAAYLWADALVTAMMPPGFAPLVDFWPNNSSVASTGTNNLLDQGIPNPILGTTSGGTAGTGASGTVAGSFTLSGQAGGSVVGSVVANTYGPGNLQRMAITSSAAADGANFAPTSSFHNAGGTFLSAGDRAYVQCLVVIDAAGILPRNLRAILIATNGSTNYLRVANEIDATKEVALPITSKRAFLLRTPDFICPSGFTITSLTAGFRATFAGAGSCQIDVGNFECRRFRA